MVVIGIDMNFSQLVFEAPEVLLPRVQLPPYTSRASASNAGARVVRGARGEHQRVRRAARDPPDSRGERVRRRLAGAQRRERHRGAQRVRAGDREGDARRSARCAAGARARPRARRHRPLRQYALPPVPSLCSPNRGIRPPLLLRLFASNPLAALVAL